MNMADSMEANKELVVIWNAIEDRTEDKAVKEYAKMKRQLLTELYDSKKSNDKTKEMLDNEYIKLVNDEIREVKSYQEKKGLS